MQFSRAAVLALVAQAHGQAPDQTSVTQDLNNQIASGNGAYNKGKGILVRTPDFFTGGQVTVVPATFWVNDIVAPSQLYPSGNPWCPHGNSDGFEDISWSKCTPTPQGPWDYATVSAVIAGETDGMPKFFKDFDSIQQSSWGWGVFYPTDANAGDKRCKQDGDGWNCPGGSVDSTGQFKPDRSKQGAGYFPMGNPDAGLGGGGAGCHFDTNQNGIDQVDAYANLPGSQGQQNLVKDANCQCNYAFNKDWGAWVENWINNCQQKKGFESRNWLHHGPKAPSWGMDTASCWVNNPKDLISLQNSIYAARHRWNNGMAPQTDNNDRRYWGWNEVPITRTVADDPSTWAAVMVKLPAQLCGGRNDALHCLSGITSHQLESDLDMFISKGKLLLGKENVCKRPGSYVVIVREYDTGNGHFERRFYCENWSSPSNKYKIVFDPQQGKDPGACFLDKGHWHGSNATTTPPVVV